MKKILLAVCVAIAVVGVVKLAMIQAAGEEKTESKEERAEGLEAMPDLTGLFDEESEVDKFASACKAITEEE